MYGLMVVPKTATTMVRKAGVKLMSGTNERSATSPHGIFTVKTTPT